jgi:hypothetical protein
MIPRNLARISPLFLVLAASLCSAEPVSRTLEITGRYLLLPVTTGAAKSRLAVRVSGRLIDEFDIELAPADPQFWVFLEPRRSPRQVRRHHRRQAAARVARLRRHPRRRHTSGHL